MRRSLTRVGRVGLALTLALVGCGGGGGGGGSAPIPCTNLSFARAIAAPGPGDVYLDGGAATCSTLDVNVLVANLTGIWTVGFDLTYAAPLLRYDSFVKGPLLLKGSPANAPAFFVTNPTAGHLQVFMTRFAPDPTVEAKGSEVLITLHFAKVATGAAPLDFDLAGGIAEQILDDTTALRPASFGPGHGGVATVP